MLKLAECVTSVSKRGKFHHFMVKDIELIILDRDGVINVDSDEYIKHPHEWHAIPKSIEAIAKLGKAGYKVVVVTNQSGIARGLFTLAELNAIHDKMLKKINAAGGHIDGIFVCPHVRDDNCDCRKPKPGLLSRVSREFNVAAKRIILVGDSERDMEAAQAFGCAFALVLTGNGRYTLENNPSLISLDMIYSDLADFVDALLGNKGNA